MSEAISERCKARVYGKDSWGRSHQCQSKAKQGGYCMRHHPDSVAQRNSASALAFQAKMKQDPLCLAYKRITLLEHQRDELLAALKRIADYDAPDAHAMINQAKAAIQKVEKP